jgi:uncharacterized membrane protein YhiD involved in acid resistance
VIALLGVTNPFEGFEDLSGTYTVADVTAALLLAFALTAVVGWVYRATHKGVSYSQSYVQTLVMLGMLTSLIMLVIGSNLARAFSLVGALSIVRFRNAVKETRDVGFLFLAMGIGMATGTRFYTLAVVATVVICGVVMVMTRFNWYALQVRSQVVKVQVPPDGDYTGPVERVLADATDVADLVSMETIRGGALVELTYSVQLKKSATPTALMAALGAVNAGQRVTVLTGFDRSDL